MMNYFRDLFGALRVGLAAAVRHMADMRYLRRGGCPDNLPF